MVHRNYHVIFGTGPVGRAVMHRLIASDQPVRIVNRIGTAAVPARVDVVQADVTDAHSTQAACRGATVVYHCMNAPYARWPHTLPSMMEGLIRGAASAGAVLVYADNVYAYGPVDQPLTEDLPYRATGPNGRARAQVATMLLNAHKQGRVQATIGRASNYYGPYGRDSTVGDTVFSALLHGRPAQVLGNPDTLHTYTYLDDVGTGLVTLRAEASAHGQTWHIPSAPTITTRAFVELVAQEIGTTARVRRAPTFGITLLALVNPTMRAVKEQLYQSAQPLIVDHRKYELAFGNQTTPHHTAIRETVAWFRQSTPRGQDR